MKITVKVGGIKIQTDGIDLTKRDIHKLLESAGSVALAILEASSIEEEPEPQRDPIGFTAHIERAPEFQLEDFFSDDEE
jgi:hypothetical protein